jgi:hypothetical protein
MKPTPKRKLKIKKQLVVARLDRIAVSGTAYSGSCVKRIRGFRVVSDFRPRAQGKLRTYDRLMKFESLRNRATIAEQYKPKRRWLSDCRFLMTADDKTGIMPDELNALLEPTLSHRISMVELALDFSTSLGVDETFVRRHGLFGKSRRRKMEYAGLLRFGSRASTKLVRCYFKTVVAAYRVEIQANSGLLRRYKIKSADELPRLAPLLHPAHIRFAALAKGPLKKHLIRKFGSDGILVYDEAKRRATCSLRLALRYLASVRITNPSRFLTPLPINDEIRLAIKRWSRKFSRPKSGVAKQKGSQAA